MSESIFTGVELVNANGDRAQHKRSRSTSRHVAFLAGQAQYPDLSKFYEQVNAEKLQLEIVFVSSHNSGTTDSRTSRRRSTDHGGRSHLTLRDDLKRKYLVAARKEQETVVVLERIRSLPTLVILEPNGEIQPIAMV
ncbi:Nucleoredoxin protein 2 [Globisporangium polare]